MARFRVPCLPCKALSRSKVKAILKLATILYDSAAEIDETNSIASTATLLFLARHALK